MKLIDLKDTIDYLVEIHGGDLEVNIYSDSAFARPAESVELLELSYMKEVLIT